MGRKEFLQSRKKGGNKKFELNYRPVNKISEFAKLIEKLMVTRLLSFFEQPNILSKFQHVFRKNKSCMTALYSFLQKWCNNLEEREKV